MINRNRGGHRSGWRKIFAINLIILLCTLTACGIPEGIKGISAGIRDELAQEAREANANKVRNVESVSTECYGYNQLDSEEQQVYDEIYDCIMNHLDKVDVSTTDTDVLFKVFSTVMADHGGIFWVTGYQYNTYSLLGRVTSMEFEPNYTYSQEEVLQLQQQIDEVVLGWMSGISAGDSDYDKAKYIFETLIQNVDYDLNSENNQNILSVFLGESTVCQGYACATQYLFNYLGMNSMIVTGVAGEEAHAWNLVQLDGQYYYMDTTWGNSKYLSEGNSDAKYINYAFMACTSQEMDRTHESQMQIELPEATATEDDYFHREGLYFSEYDKDAIGETVASAWYRGMDRISIKMGNDELYQQVKQYMVDDGAIFDWCVGLRSINYIENAQECILNFQF